MAQESISFAFYCSGHGFGHATRVSALTTSLLAAGHSVSIVTNAPLTPFSAVLPPTTSDASALNPLPKYATYRKRNVDAGIVQPKAYDVDRKATFEVLKGFMEGREGTIREEVEWLKEEGVQCVLSDATFLGCAAAAGAGIPAIIVSNFTFDSCYSYLSHPTLPSLLSPSTPLPEPPLPPSLLDPLVNLAISDYRHASLLLRLPGAIPIPSFDTDVPLPSGSWVNPDRTSFTPEILDLLARPTNTIPRKVVDVPLIVRPPNKDVYAPEFRANLLNSMGVPEHLQGSKILLVSFGGQSIPRPRSRPPTPLSTPLLRSGSRSSLGGGGGGSSTLEVTDLETREAGLLPKGWIAIVCGLSGNNNEIRNDLPEGFYASERDVNVPDLTATCDVVLGKLGYGTCSETISTRTPFVYVPRPLFIEEFGLSRLMTQRGVSLELSREDFEAGRWEFHISEAWERGRERKEEQRRTGFPVEFEQAGERIREEVERFLREREVV
ncbi:hypothetical protein BCR35DRAFT_353092 [Leucosporidium creatinivorum]|uniref:Uncharacterized protein n=1 Tax=Leucosporidium creatinivorum TaxID=106004 RepID=A0A1Y2F142_9BASI|nr:hypothetical protein BCR35DRAFT_353092 [Leucosporidium creatinivorum]